MTSKGNKPKTLLIDVLGAPDKSGGMQLVAEETIRNWPQNDTFSTILIVGPPWMKKFVESNRLNYRVVVWPNQNPVFRILGQMFIVPIIGLVFRIDRYLALNCVVSPLLKGRNTTVVAHDWRHISRPTEFSALQVFYRRMWKNSANLSTKIVAVSEKTYNETTLITGRTDVVLWGLGGDHPSKWTIDSNNLQNLHNNVLTYGLHTNKRPGLVVSAFLNARNMKLIPRNSQLTVLGLNVENASEDIRQAAEQHPKVLKFPGFVNPEEYQRLMAGSRFAVLASSDEGYGLPVVESAYWGKKTLVSDDSGLQGIHGDLVIAVPPRLDEFSQGIGFMWSMNKGVIAQNKPWKQAAQELHDIVSEV